LTRARSYREKGKGSSGNTGKAPRQDAGKAGKRAGGKVPRQDAGKAGKRAGGKAARQLTQNTGNETIRLNKYIAASGICSRREADELITAGLITVNGKKVTELGSKVRPDDDVRYNGERLHTERKVYLLLNKPKDYVTTTDDPRERKTVMLLVRNACKERIYPVGRLDRNTTGVLLFTNDGELAKKMTHPSHNKKKIYHVFLNKNLSGNDLKKLATGITLEDGFIQPDALSYVSSENKREIGLEIHSGKNRIVRRMFESLGYRVDKLDRVYFAGLTKKNLPRGKWRFLSEREVNSLKMNAYE
jgi:23S rRNA pseudouridine2605 synthase